ncbi:ComF family protein [Aliiruegeria haliotis]|uniref:ComF family protein n=2 Tax=Aliiruegeria haliotis TaxID=1280846 RepID=A0A2T0RPG5_9RHOB|nr:ComF family protein [Aliiruegeria haliotis]
MCDDCLNVERPWTRGRAAMAYRDNARRLVLRFKHGDRTEMAPALAEWLAGAGQEIIEPGMLVAPVPLHWRRLFSRRYNQAALLSEALARRMALPSCPDLLLRRRFTGSQGGKSHDQRFANIASAIVVNPRRMSLLSDARVLLVDDVMTSGATFAACAEAIVSAGAKEVRVLALARVAKDD